MDYKLKNGLIMKLSGKGEKVNNTYVEIKASGYHGDMDFDVNNNTKLYFNDNAYDFKDLIALYAYQKDASFDELKEEYRKLFKDADDFEYMRDEWNGFLTDYSERHDTRIILDCKIEYIIDGVKYEDSDVHLDIFIDD